MSHWCAAWQRLISNVFVCGMHWPLVTICCRCARMIADNHAVFAPKVPSHFLSSRSFVSARTTFGFTSQCFNVGRSVFNITHWALSSYLLLLLIPWPSMDCFDVTVTSANQMEICRSLHKLERLALSTPNKPEEIQLFQSFRKMNETNSKITIRSFSFAIGVIWNLFQSDENARISHEYKIFKIIRSTMHNSRAHERPLI